MKNLFYLLILASIGSILFSSCEKIEGIGPIVSEFRNKTDYAGLQISVCGQINFKVTPQYSIELRAHRNILDEIVTKVDGNALVIKWDKPIRDRNCEDITIQITGPDLKFIHSSGASNIDVEGAVKHHELDLQLSGSGNIDIEHTEITDEIVAHVSGSGNIKIRSGGVVDETDLFVSGSGNIDFGRLPMDYNTSHVGGSGRITVNVLKSLEALISGSGDVYYYGNPRVTSKISGSGRVKQL